MSSNSTVYDATLDIGRVMLAADTLGAAQNMIDQSVAYAMQREQFNRVIASFQAVKHMCAQMAADLEPCRSLIWFASHALAELPDESRVTACHQGHIYQRLENQSQKLQLKYMEGWASQTCWVCTTGLNV